MVHVIVNYRVMGFDLLNGDVKMATVTIKVELEPDLMDTAI